MINVDVRGVLHGITGASWSSARHFLVEPGTAISMALTTVLAFSQNP